MASAQRPAEPVHRSGSTSDQETTAHPDARSSEFSKDPLAAHRAPLPSRGAAPAPSTRRQTITLVSFGFKYGAPPANHSFDVSFLKNPARQEGWDLFSEPDAEMRAWILAQPEARTFLEHATPLAQFLASADDDARIALGCSAGRHRSAILTEELAQRLRDLGLDVRVRHRERIDCPID